MEPVVALFAQTRCSGGQRTSYIILSLLLLKSSGIYFPSEHSFLLEMASSYYFEKTPVRRFLSVHHPKEDSSSDEDETESGVALESQPKDASNKGKPQIVRGNFQPFSL